jgi:hypothetical protein
LYCSAASVGASSAPLRTEGSFGPSGTVLVFVSGSLAAGAAAAGSTVVILLPMVVWFFSFFFC